MTKDVPVDAPEADPVRSTPTPIRNATLTHPAWQRVRRAYSTAALLVFNTILLLLLFNLACYAGLLLYDSLKPSAKEVDYSAVERQAYGGLSKEEIQAIRRETRVAHVFEPFTMFRDRPRRGKYVNVDVNGFRHSRQQGPWPPAREYFNVFFFGGSTGFGWALPDDHTVASYLQQELANVAGKKVYVYNFGRSYYYSTQERILFEQLVAAGHLPNVAIFLDGVNDLYRFEEKPAYASRFAGFMDKRSPSLFAAWPMFRVAQGIRSRWGALSKADEAGEGQSGAPPQDQSERGATRLEAEVARYLGNKKLIEAAAAAYGVVPVFVWQPVPAYKYDLKYHPYVRTGMWRLEGYAEAYQYFASRSWGSSWGRNFLWCADIQEGANKPLYVDIIHYSPEMSHLVAKCIVQQAKERKLFVPD
jgi:hypothetical protein